MIVIAISLLTTFIMMFPIVILALLFIKPAKPNKRLGSVLR
jgi:hypothetical protein